MRATACVDGKSSDASRASCVGGKEVNEGGGGSFCRSNMEDGGDGDNGGETVVALVAVKMGDVGGEAGMGVEATRDVAAAFSCNGEGLV